VSSATVASTSSSILVAGAARVDVTPPVGVPLAGFGSSSRRQSVPNFDPNALAHLLQPSTGVRDPICARALFLSDGTSPVAIVTLDAVAMTDEFVQTVFTKAQALGSTVPLSSVMFCASHTHSGPGAVTHLLMWEIAAVDLYHDSVFQSLTDGAAQALVQAERSARPAVVGAGSGQIPNATHNRRAGVSPTFQSNSVDPEVVVLRVDDVTGAPIATLWNFAIHGTSLGDTSYVLSSDIMGGANAQLEQNGTVALFVNSGEGDISPNWFDDSGIKTGGPILADAVSSVRANTNTLSSVPLASVDQRIDFGQATFDLSLQRLGSSGTQMLAQFGWLSAIQALGANFGMTIPIPSGTLETQFRFQAIRVGKWGFTSIPGEAIHTIALDLKAYGQTLGYEHVFTCGLANGHMGYCCTEPEYNAGGYEALLTLFGSKQADKLEASCEAQLAAIKP
jgi:hypothetical protein